MKINQLFISFIFLLSGCAIGPRYHQPSMELPQSYRSFETISQGEAMADLPWWKVFDDAALQDILRESLLNNYDLRIASSRVDESRAVWKTTRSEIFPHTDLTAAAARSRNSKEALPLEDRLTSDFSGGFSSSWEVDVWGRIRQSIRAAKAEYLASEEARRGVVITLVGDVAQAYFTLAELDLELSIANDTLKTRLETLNLFEKRLQGGAASALEVAQARADYEETAANIPALQRRIVVEENRLSYLLGRNPGTIKRGLELSSQTLPPSLPSAGLPSDLLKRRPDIMQAEQQLKAANARVGAAVTEFLPKLNLSNFIGGSGDEPAHLWSGEGYTWTLGGETKLPLFAGGKNVYSYKAAEAKWRGTIAEYKKTVLSAFRDVADALAGVDKLRLVREEQEKQVKALKEACKLSMLRYDGGLSSYLEVLDADRRYYAAQLELARTEGSQWLALIQLYRALGGGWQLEKTSAKV